MIDLRKGKKEEQVEEKEKEIGQKLLMCIIQKNKETEEENSNLRKY